MIPLPSGILADWGLLLMSKEPDVLSSDVENCQFVTVKLCHQGGVTMLTSM